MSFILAVDNEERMCRLIKASLELEGHTVETAFSGSEALQKIDSLQKFDIVVTDLKMNNIDGLQVLSHVCEHSPGTEVIIITAFATQETALEAMKKGAYDYLIKPFKMDELSLRIQRIIKQKEIENENKLLREKKGDSKGFPGIIGKSSKMRRIYQQIEQVSQSDTAVLIRGESGTGKELTAKAVHSSSKRKNGPFVAVNCAALPENLLESELFGFEKGAFTGADKQKAGLFETAENGTFFLDEIGDLPLSLQAKLLRVLQDNEVYHLGGREAVKVNFRLITATHRNLEKMTAEGSFRQDLYYRISIFPIELPPLRDRREDIPELLQHFLKEFPEKPLSAEARRKLIEYDYPGNIRELENIITRASISAESVITENDLIMKSSPDIADMADIYSIPDGGINLDELEMKLIEAAVRKAEGNKTKAAQLLGLTRRRLYSMMERFGISK